MEGSESEEVFEALNLNPQLFLNEILNNIDDLVQGAFDQFHSEASKLVDADGTNRSEDLQKGIVYINSIIEASLAKNLSMWEKYCLRFCFTVPSGFSLPSGGEASGDDPMDQDDLNDEQVNERLSSLRKKLVEAGKECAELNQELQVLEKKSVMSNQYISSVNEALQLYEKSSAQDMFQEMFKVASELRRKMEQLKSKQKEDVEHHRSKRACISNGDMPKFNLKNDISKLRLDDLQEIISKMKS